MSSNNNIVALLEDLISFESVTPDNSGCQKYIDKYLSKSHFKTEYKKYDDVQNMISTHGSGAPCLAFIGHTDVVPAGNIDSWKSQPFQLTKREGFLMGRGTSDMKGGIACFMQAAREFIDENDKIQGSIKIILTW
jgi:succinyl-diaminopimelate desuccinylase